MQIPVQSGIAFSYFKTSVSSNVCIYFLHMNKKISRVEPKLLTMTPWEKKAELERENGRILAVCARLNLNKLKLDSIKIQFLSSASSISSGYHT